MELISVCVPASTISSHHTAQLSSLARHALMLQCNCSLRSRGLLENNIKIMKIIVFRVVASINPKERSQHFGERNLLPLPSGWKSVTVTVTVIRTANLNQPYDCLQEKKPWEWKVEGTGTRPRLMTSFGRRSVESSASTVRVSQSFSQPDNLIVQSISLV
jgi:hypothetical protein